MRKKHGTKRDWFRRRFTLYTKTAQAEQPPQINNPFRKIVRARSISVSIYRFEESGLYLRLGLRHDIIGRATLNRSKRREWGEPPFPPLPPPETGDAEGRRRDRIIFDHEKWNVNGARSRTACFLRLFCTFVACESKLGGPGNEPGQR